MKRMLFTGLMIIMVSSPFGMVHGQMYWDQSDVPDATIKDSDFGKPSPDRKAAKSFGELEIYDDFQVPDIEEPAAAQTTAPVAAPSSTTEPPAVAPRRTGTTRSTTDLLRRPRATIRRSTERTSRPRPDVSQPKPAETSPGEPSAVTKSPEPSTSGPARDAGTTAAPGATTGLEEADRPATKRMKWGQPGESKVEEPKPKLQWGR